MGEYSSCYLIISSSNCTGIKLPDVLKPWNMAHHHLCIYHDCQCCSGMGTASATRYLNSYLLIFMIVGAVVGVFVANPSCNLAAFTSFNVDGQYMFPILFVTIACGAVSGFHSLVSSGTASKQIKNEKICFRYPSEQC